MMGMRRRGPTTTTIGSFPYGALGGVLHQRNRLQEKVDLATHYSFSEPVEVIEKSSLMLVQWRFNLLTKKK